MLIAVSAISAVSSVSVVVAAVVALPGRRCRESPPRSATALTAVIAEPANAAAASVATAARLVTCMFPPFWWGASGGKTPFRAIPRTEISKSHARGPSARLAGVRISRRPA